MEAKARIKMNFNTGEFEAEGTEQFVHSSVEKVRNYFSGGSVATAEAPKKQVVAKEENAVNNGQVIGETEKNKSAKKTRTTAKNALPGSLDDFINSVNDKKLSDTAKILVAGYYLQQNSSDGHFASREVNEMLKERGILPATPAQSVFLNIKNNRLSKLERGRYKVTDQGLQHLKKLLGAK